MRYLVDANVLSEATKPLPDQAVLRWLRRNERQFAVDPVILGELRFGILLLPEGKRRRQLETWFEEGVCRLTCLPWDTAMGLRWAELLADLRRKGKTMPLKDSMIAATALVHKLILATRNTDDFSDAGLRLVNPFSKSGE